MRRLPPGISPFVATGMSPRTPVETRRKFPSSSTVSIGSSMPTSKDRRVLFTEWRSAERCFRLNVVEVLVPGTYRAKPNFRTVAPGS